MLPPWSGFAPFVVKTTVPPGDVITTDRVSGEPSTAVAVKV